MKTNLFQKPIIFTLVLIFVFLCTNCEDELELNDDSLDIAKIESPILLELREFEINFKPKKSNSEDSYKKTNDWTDFQVRYGKVLYDHYKAMDSTGSSLLIPLVNKESILQSWVLGEIGNDGQIDFLILENDTINRPFFIDQSQKLQFAEDDGKIYYFDHLMTYTNDESSKGNFACGPVYKQECAAVVAETDPDPIWHCDLVYQGETCVYISALQTETYIEAGDSASGGENNWEPFGGNDSSNNDSNDTEEKDDCDISLADILSAFPDADFEILEKLKDLLNQYGADFGINTATEMRHFLAQTAHETANFSKLSVTEDLFYTTEARLMTVFNKYFPENDATRDPADYLRNSKKLGDLVYGNRMGNASDEGYKYRGRGIIQLTGKNNYQAFQDFYNSKVNPPIDVIADPDLLISNDNMAIISALWFYKENLLDKIDVNNTPAYRVSEIVNGGKNGLEERIENFNEIKDDIKCVDRIIIQK